MRWILALLIVAFVGLQYRLWIGDGSWEQIVELEREIEVQREINERLENRNAILESEIRDLKNGLESVENRARTELGLIKKGETFFLIDDKNQ